MRLLVPVLALLLPLSAGAQVGGFPSGEVLIYSPFVTGTSNPGAGAIVRCDPVTGQASVVTAVTDPQYRPGSICVDAWRDAVLFYGNPGPSGPQQFLYSLTASGQLTNLGFQGDRLQLLCPGTGGRVYLHDETAGGVAAPLRYLDSANVRHDLLDASGSAPFSAPGLPFLSAIAYDPGTNKLLVALPSTSGTPFCAGGSGAPLTVLGLSLSADGTRVLSSSCSQFAPDPLGANYPVSLSRMSDGDFLLVVDTNSNASQPRFLRVDPATLAIGIFATNGPYTGAAITDAGCWSSKLGQALFLNNWSSSLETFGQGGSAGTPVSTSMPLTTPGVFGFLMTMTEVTGAGCSGAVISYCTAGTSASGCQASLCASGAPSATATSGFQVSAFGVEGQKDGILFFGTSGRQASPWGNGSSLQCVVPPVKRAGLLNGTGTTGMCDGTLAQDLNALWCSACPKPGANPGMGAVVQLQLWYRDPQNTSNQTTSLSDAIEFAVGP